MVTPSTTPTTTCPRRCSRSGPRRTRSSCSRGFSWRPAFWTRTRWPRSVTARGKRRSRPARRRCPIRCRIRPRSRKVSMPTDAKTRQEKAAQEKLEHATYLDAIGAALMSEMEADPDVFIIGEDVGQFGGAFKVTKGFLEKFGERRVVDTPIAETGFTGLAAGAALVGLRPVVEFQFADFISCAFDPIINVLARHHWRTGDPMPVTMRAPFGGRLRAGPTHSQSVESYFAHVPGIKIVMPGTPEDAAGLLVSAIRDNTPTLYLENKYLYRRLRASGPLSLEPIPLGVAKVVREGRDVSLITYSAGVTQGLEVAEELDKDGISVEVVDVRTIVPLDVETIVDSVRKTSRAVVLHEAPRRAGYGAEIAPPIQEEAFWHLDQPVVRIGAKNTPVPTSPPLEDAVIPQPAEIAETLRKVARA